MYRFQSFEDNAAQELQLALTGQMAKHATWSFFCSKTRHGAICNLDILLVGAHSDKTRTLNRARREGHDLAGLDDRSITHSLGRRHCGRK